MAQLKRFNMGLPGEADCPVFDGVFEYCQVRCPDWASLRHPRVISLLGDGLSDNVVPLVAPAWLVWCWVHKRPLLASSAALSHAPLLTPVHAHALSRCADVQWRIRGWCSHHCNR